MWKYLVKCKGCLVVWGRNDWFYYNWINRENQMQSVFLAQGNSQSLIWLNENNSLKHRSQRINEFGDDQSYLTVIVKMKQMKWIDYSNLIEVKLAIITLLLFRTKQIKSKGYQILSRMHSKQVDDDAIENATLNKMIWNWHEIEIQNYLIK